MAGTVGRVQNLVVEDREVQGKAEADGVRRGQLGLGNVGSALVGLVGGRRGAAALVAGGELGQVAVVVTLPVGLSALLVSWKKKTSRKQ